MEQNKELERQIRDHLKKTVIKATALPIILERYKVLGKPVSELSVSEVVNLQHNPDVGTKLRKHKSETLGFVGSVRLDD